MDRSNLLAALTALTTLAAAAAFAHIVAVDGLQAVDLILIALYAVLTGWLAHGFWLAVIGACVLALRRLKVAAGARSSAFDRAALPPRLPPGQHTAIVIPVYNEDPARVFAGIRAMLGSLDATGHGDGFEIFVLSDTRHPDIWLQEEAEWAALRASDRHRARVFYRRRLRNTGRKTGNLKDFLERWGSRYRYMVVFDADSVMAGPTLIEMVRRMEASPDTALIQVPPKPVNGETLFARMQEFAGSVYGPLSAAGLSWCAQGDGNFWGHNAIIRVEAFIEHCDLPLLPGRAPLGGEILSHDFVEAAMLRRAGWKLRLADDLGGSWEETPPTIIDFAKRDRRWCQGNMQHARLLFARFLHPSSRYYFGTGVMAYASSLVWALFLVVGGIELVRRSLTEPVYFQGETPFPVWPVSVEQEATTLLAITLAALFVPKLLGLVFAVLTPERRRAQGGALRLGIGVVLESFYSALLAPVMMMFHAGFVLSILLGASVGWGPQRRGGGGAAVAEAVRAHATHTLTGLAAGAAILFVAPDVFWWTVPILLGLVVSIPLSLVSASSRAGRALRRAGLLLTEEEGRPPPVLARRAALLAGARPPEPASRFEALLRDSRLTALHAGLVRANGEQPELDPVLLGSLERKAIEAGPGTFTIDERLSVLQNAEATERLHRMLAGRPAAQPSAA